MRRLHPVGRGGCSSGLVFEPEIGPRHRVPGPWRKDRCCQEQAGNERRRQDSARPFFGHARSPPLAFDTGRLGPVAHAAKCITAGNGAGLPRGSTGTIEKIDSEGAAGKNSPGGPKQPRWPRRRGGRQRAGRMGNSLACAAGSDGGGFPCKPEARARDDIHAGEPAVRSPGRVPAVRARRSRHRRGS